MKRVKIKSDQINFIGSWNLENNDLCKNIINFFESHKEMQIQGLTDGGGKDTAIKKTTDISIDPNDLKSKEYSVLKDYIEELFKCFNDYQNRRHEVRPGITGLAQVNGRDNISIEEKVNFDFQYLKNKSITLDFKIVFLTIFKILKSTDVSH